MGGGGDNGGDALSVHGRLKSGRCSETFVVSSEALAVIHHLPTFAGGVDCVVG